MCGVVLAHFHREDQVADPGATTPTTFVPRTSSKHPPAIQRSESIQPIAINKESSTWFVSAISRKYRASS